MPAGRPPKSPEAHALAGNPGKRQANAVAVSPRPDPGADAPTPPEQLKGLAREVWLKHAAQLHQLRLLTPLDHSLFEMYCVSYANWRTFEELSEKVGPQDSVKLGYRSAADKAMHRAESIGRPFGLDPKSRNALKMPPGPVQTSLPGLDKDQKAELIRGTFHVASRR